MYISNCFILDSSILYRTKSLGRVIDGYIGIVSSELSKGFSRV